jgi:hypothetical protein
MRPPHNRWPPEEEAARSHLIAACATVAAASLAVASVGSGGGGALPAGNLLQNPGAEDGTCSPSGEPVAIPGWTTAVVNADGPSAGFTAVCYGSSEFADATVSAAVNGGNSFFAGGQNTILSTASQTVDVSSVAAEIDAAKVAARISAHIGGFSTQDDHGVVRLSFADGAGKRLGYIQIGPVTADARGGKTTLLRRSRTANVPPGTRSLVVTMTATRLQGAFDDGYFDNLDLELAPVRLAPRQGVIQRAWMSIPGSRRAVSRVRATNALIANFTFRALPVSGSELEVRWFVNGKRQTEFTHSEPRIRYVRSSISSGRGISRGAYKTVLYVRPPGRRFTPVAAARARVG